MRLDGDGPAEDRTPRERYTFAVSATRHKETQKHRTSEQGYVESLKISNGTSKSSKWQSLDLEGNNNGLNTPAPERVTFVCNKAWPDRGQGHLVGGE